MSAYATKFCNRERDSSYLHPAPGSVIVSAHSPAICSPIDARLETWAVSIEAGQLAMLCRSHPVCFGKSVAFGCVFQRS
jgi:hypothetical protein